MNELLGRFQAEFGLTSERLLEVVCEAILLCEKTAKERLEKAFMKSPPRTLESELDWHREVSRRVLAEQLRRVYAERYSDHSARALKRHAFSLAQEVLGNRLPPSLRNKHVKLLSIHDVALLFRVLGVKSRLAEALEEEASYGE